MKDFDHNLLELNIVLEEPADFTTYDTTHWMEFNFYTSHDFIKNEFETESVLYED